MFFRSSLAVGIVLLGEWSAAAPPRVVEVVPANEATDVDPGARRLRVVFDQEMNPAGYSIVGGGDTFPEVTGKVRWLDKKTCVVPVRLKPSHPYRLSLNSETFTNFKNVAGEAAIAYPWSFHTGPGEQKPSQPSDDENRESLSELRHAIDKNYSHRDLHGVKWNDLFTEAAPTLLAAKTRDEFVRRAADVLKANQDLHLWLKANDADPLTPTYRAPVSPNFKFLAVERGVPHFQAKSKAVYAGHFDDGIVYVLITTWDAGQAKQIEAAYKVLEQSRDAQALIVDVRPNSGGDEQLAREFAGCFLSEPEIYAQHRIVEDGKLSDAHYRIVAPSAHRPAIRGRVAVLMGRANMSSCESFLLMMKQAPRTTLIGQRSRGSSGNPQPIALANGVTVFVPVWQDLRADGSCFEGEGIAPDREVEGEPTDKSDPVLDAALSVLREGK
jgi:hypothetical protein